MNLWMRFDHRLLLDFVYLTTTIELHSVLQMIRRSKSFSENFSASPASIDGLQHQQYDL